MKFKIKNYVVSTLISSLFQMMVISYLLLLTLESLFKGAVSWYVNLTYFCIIILITGIIAAHTKKIERKKNHPTNKEFIFLYFLGAAISVVLFFYMSQLGMLRFVVSSLTGLLIIGIGYVVLYETDN